MNAATRINIHDDSGGDTALTPAWRARLNPNERLTWEALVYCTEHDGEATVGSLAQRARISVHDLMKAVAALNQYGFLGSDLY
jgi:hypothetical protein